MKLRPTIFLSGVSSEFGSFRDAVEIEIEKKGCFAENQPIIGFDYLTVREMLRRRIHDADAVIHIVGYHFGAEPKDQPADRRRRSYTQMEYDIAHELKKPVYVFLSADASVCDTPGEPEDGVAKTLQLAHRQATASTDLYKIFRDKAELSRLAAEIPLVAVVDFRGDISRIHKYVPKELVGRDNELRILDEAWLKVCEDIMPRPRVISFVGPGGQGKTALVAKWVTRFAEQNWRDCDAAFAWSFYSGSIPEQVEDTSDLFFKEAINFFGTEVDKAFEWSGASTFDKGRRLAQLVGQQRSLLILDGLEGLQFPPTSSSRVALKNIGLNWSLKDLALRTLLQSLAADSRGLCIITDRYSLPELTGFGPNAKEVNLSRLAIKVAYFQASL